MASPRLGIVKSSQKNVNGAGKSVAAERQRRLDFAARQE